MIVRNEAGVIERCLRSVRDLIDSWVIFDTGSEDDTCDRITACLAGLPGELRRSRWIDFGHNRSEAIQAARGRADYILILDADMVVETDAGFDLDGLEADSYLVRYAGSIDYRQAMLVRGDLPWYFVGVTHEYLHLDAPYSRDRIDTLRLRHLGDGMNRGEKFERDLRLLNASVAADPGDTRSLFYFAQTLQCLERWDEAIAWYRRRAEAGGWEEEVWYSRYQIAVAQKAKGEPWPIVLASLLDAYRIRPARLEPLYVIARHYRETGAYPLGHLFSRPICDASYPADVLFVESDVYRYLLAFEYSICCYWVGEHAEALRVTSGLLDLPDLPPSHVEAVLRNRAFSLERLHEQVAEADRRRRRLKVVVPFYNAGCYLQRCVAALLAQDLDDFTAVFVDDASTDGYGALVPVDDPRVTLVRNAVRIGPVASLHAVVVEHCEPGEIVAVVSGEDWLSTDAALRTVQDVYALYDCWVMYGQFCHPDGRYGHAKPFPDASWFSPLRDLSFVAPILTFRAELYHRLAEQDPGCRCLKDGQGRWRFDLESAVMPPLLELAGFDRVVFQDQPLYVFNRLRWQEGWQ